MPYARYRAELQRLGLVHDPAQDRAMQLLQRVRDELVAAPALEPPRNGGLFNRLLRRDATPMRPPVRGAYLWGGVGRGKTWLVDTFFHALDVPGKQRVHFHRFMQSVHARLRDLRQVQDPLDRIAAELAADTRVLCLDEFVVTDITDAMLLAGLFNGLFSRGVTLVTTSNCAPDALYRDGLQRARFLPAIEMLKQHLEVLNVDGGVDYRLRYLERADIYHVPADADAERVLNEAFEHIAPDAGERNVVVRIEDRGIAARRVSDGVVWFDFAAICDGPRSQHDYIELARCHHTVLISRVPVFTWETENQARRFINLVDEFYDRGVKLVVSAAAGPAALYQGERLHFEFERTASRLQEMRSHAYLARPHLP